MVFRGGKGSKFELSLSCVVERKLYPKKELQKKIDENPNLVEKIWKNLKAIGCEDMESEGRIYGGGLKKIEPKELANVVIGLWNL